MINIKRGSSLHQLDTLFNQQDPSRSLCTLFWACIFNLAILALVILAVGWFVGDGLGGIAASIATGSLILTPFLAAVIALLIAVLFAIALALFDTGYKEFRIEDKVKSTVVYKGYRSWKDKVCPIINVVD